MHLCLYMVLMFKKQKKKWGGSRSSQGLMFHSTGIKVRDSSGLSPAQAVAVYEHNHETPFRTHHQRSTGCFVRTNSGLLEIRYTTHPSPQANCTVVDCFIPLFTETSSTGLGSFGAMHWNPPKPIDIDLEARASFAQSSETHPSPQAFARSA